MSVSVPHLHLANNERITGFEIHIRSGRIARLPNVPIGWSISVNNDPSWNTAIEGSIAVGAAAVGPDFFRRFMVVEEETGAPRTLPFDIYGEVFVTSDFENERRIKLSMKDFVTKTIGSTKTAERQ